MLLHPDTYNLQKKVADYCRTGVMVVDIEGIKIETISHYRRLVYNIIDDILRSAFPITFNYLPEEEWSYLVNDFFSNHSCKNPQVWKLPFEFVKYANNHFLNIKEKYSFLLDLLEFEWLEMDVFSMPDQPSPTYKLDGNWMQDTIILNPEFRLVSYNYPVHMLPPSKLKQEDEKKYFVLAYRHPFTKHVEFFNLSPLHVFVLEKIAFQGQLLRKIIEEACLVFSLKNKIEVSNHIIGLLKNLQTKKFVLGFK